MRTFASENQNHIDMTYFNQFHKESVERCLRKIAQSKSLHLNAEEEVEKMQKMHQELRLLYQNAN